jgi:hypothetical protein
MRPPTSILEEIFRQRVDYKNTTGEEPNVVYLGEQSIAWLCEEFNDYRPINDQTNPVKILNERLYGMKIIESADIWDVRASVEDIWTQG